DPRLVDRRAEDARTEALRNRGTGILPRLAVDADIIDRCARHAGDVYPRAEHAGKIAILVDVRPSLGLFIAANLPAVAGVSFNAVMPAAELAAEVEARVKRWRRGQEAPFGHPCGAVARQRNKVPILFPARRDDGFTADLH